MSCSATAFDAFTGVRSCHTPDRTPEWLPIRGTLGIRAIRVIDSDRTSAVSPLPLSFNSLEMARGLHSLGPIPSCRPGLTIRERSHEMREFGAINRRLGSPGSEGQAGLEEAIPRTVR
jgi:hypothetical protein